MGKWHLSVGDGIGCNTLKTTPNAVLYEQCKQIMYDAGFNYADASYIDNMNNPQGFSHNPEWMVSEAKKFINEAVNVRQQPFFLYFAFTLNHSPDADNAILNYDDTQTPAGIIDPPNSGMRNRSDIYNQANQLFGYNAEYREEAIGTIWIDDAVRALFEYLENGLNVLDDTMIVFMNDHNTGVGRSSLYNGGIRGYEFIRYPPLFPINNAPYILPEDFIVSNIDLAAVVAEIVGIDDVEQTLPGYIVDGISWLDDVLTFVANPNANEITNNCCKYRFADMYHSHAVFTKDYKYLYRAHEQIAGNEELIPAYPHIHDVQHLYNFNTDPFEQNNIIFTNDSLKNLTFDFQLLIIQHINETSCHLDDLYDCVLPNITYIPAYSDYMPPTPTPPPTLPPGTTCQLSFNFTTFWRGVLTFNETSEGPIKRDEGEQLMINHQNTPSECRDNIDFIEYYYRFRHIRRRLWFDMIVCCPAYATFGPDYIPPNGYQLSSNPASAMTINSDLDDSQQTVIIISVCCCCIIIVAFLYYVYYKKQKKETMEQSVAGVIKRHSTEPKHANAMSGPMDIEIGAISNSMDDKIEDGLELTTEIVFDNLSAPVSRSHSPQIPVSAAMALSQIVHPHHV